MVSWSYNHCQYINGMCLWGSSEMCQIHVQWWHFWRTQHLDSLRAIWHQWLLWILMVFHCESMVSWPYNNYEWPYFWNETSSKSAVTTICQAVASKRSSIEDLVLMRTKLRTKLLKWSSIGPHFTQKASFSPCSSYMIYLRTWKCYSAIRCGIIHMNLVKHASPGKWDNMTVKKN